MGPVHVAAAIAGLICGGLVITRPKGTMQHRVVGGSYAALLLLVNIAALAIPRPGGDVGPFQALAVVSIVTLFAGLVPMWLMTRSAKVVAVHGVTMLFSYVGLVAAGLSQVAAQHIPDHAALGVPTVSLLTFAVGGCAIFARLPTTINRLGPRPSDR